MSYSKYQSIIMPIINEVYEEYGPYSLPLKEYVQKVYEKIENLANFTYDKRFMREFIYENLKMLIEANDPNYVFIIDNDYQTCSSYQEYFKSLKELPSLTQEERDDLALKAFNGDSEAKKMLITANLKLVFNIVRYYNNCGVEVQELIQEGNLALIKAVNRFDPTKGYRFSSYATKFIRYHLINYLRNINNSLNFAPRKSYETALQTKIDPSLSIEETYEQKEMRRTVKEVIAKVDLNPQEEKALIKDESISLRQLGRNLGMSAERIRQKKSTALRKLRTDSLIEQLALYTSNPESALTNLANFQIIYALDHRAMQISNVNLEDYQALIMEINKYQSLYTYFSEYNYTEKEINTAISYLEPNYQEIIRIKYFLNKDKNGLMPLTSKQIRLLYNKIIPKLIQILETIYPKTVPIRKRK